jgi:phospholipase C
MRLMISNADSAKPVTIHVKDNAYKSGEQVKKLGAGDKTVINLDLSRSFGWYDFTVSVQGNKVFEKRYAGRVETGKTGYTDPAMGNV